MTHSEFQNKLEYLIADREIYYDLWYDTSNIIYRDKVDLINERIHELYKLYTDELIKNC